MAEPKTKKDIVQYLADRAGIPAARAEAVLDGLVDLVIREAPNGIRIPGLCKFRTADQKARYGRNPQTGERILIKARKLLKMTPLKKARDAIASLPVDAAVAGQVPGTPAPAPTPAAPPSPASPPEPSAIPSAVPMSPPAAAAPPAPVPQAVPQAEAVPQAVPMEPAPAADVVWLTFNCHQCNQEIEASSDLAGMEAVCPSCQTVLTVPAVEQAAVSREPVNQLPYNVTDMTAPESEASNQTMRIDLSLEDMEDLD